MRKWVTDSPACLDEVRSRSGKQMIHCGFVGRIFCQIKLLKPPRNSITCPSLVLGCELLNWLQNRLRRIDCSMKHSGFWLTTSRSNHSTELSPLSSPVPVVRGSAGSGAGYLINHLKLHARGTTPEPADVLSPVPTPLEREAEIQLI